jgi:hypothetical protein
MFHGINIECPADQPFPHEYNSEENIRREYQKSKEGFNL